MRYDTILVLRALCCCFGIAAMSSVVAAFVPSSSQQRPAEALNFYSKILSRFDDDSTSTRRRSCRQRPPRVLSNSVSTNTNEEMLPPSTEEDLDSALESPSPPAIDPKDAVRLFGRLAEKYIALDSSGGSCCYSACTDCEYRLPGGGYIMADQTAARPKWIPCYESRQSNARLHTTQWSTHLFVPDNNDTSKSSSAVTATEFVERLVHQMDHLYAPPLASGGPYVGASDATLRDTVAAEQLFRVLMGSSSNSSTRKLTKHKMSVRLRELADGEEGLMWPAFARAMGCL